MTFLYLDLEATPPLDLSEEERLAMDREGDEPGFRWRELAKNPWEARVCAVGWAIADADVQAVAVHSGENLRPMAEEMWRHRNGLVFVAHNGKDYDIPLLFSEFMRAGWTKAAEVVARCMHGKPWERPIVDTMNLGTWRGPKLDTLAKTVGVPGKLEGMHGSKVLDAWLSGPEGQALTVKYVAQDVETLRNTHRKLLEVGLGRIQ